MFKLLNNRIGSNKNSKETVSKDVINDDDNDDDATWIIRHGGMIADEFRQQQQQFFTKFKIMSKNKSSNNSRKKRQHRRHRHKVRFSNHVSGHLEITTNYCDDLPLLSKMSKEERHLLWYNQNDLKSMKENAVQISKDLRDKEEEAAQAQQASMDDYDDRDDNDESYRDGNNDNDNDDVDDSNIDNDLLTALSSVELLHGTFGNSMRKIPTMDIVEDNYNKWTKLYGHLHRGLEKFCCSSELLDRRKTKKKVTLRTIVKLYNVLVLGKEKKKEQQQQQDEEEQQQDRKEEEQDNMTEEDEEKAKAEEAINIQVNTHVDEYLVEDFSCNNNDNSVVEKISNIYQTLSKNAKDYALLLGKADEYSAKQIYNNKRAFGVWY